MQDVERIIAEHLDEAQTAFVFPSEVAAEFWRRRSLSLTTRRALWRESFLSWDRFKEESLALAREAVPINGATRTLFVADLLRQNAAGLPFLSSIVNPRFAADSGQFRSAVASILPELARFRETALRFARREAGRRNADAPPGLGLLDPALAADLDVLWRRYTAFLHEHHLFEPSYETAKSAELTREYHVFFPEVIEDWQQFAGSLPASHVKAHPAAEGASGRLVRFANVHQETRSLLERVAELLDSGVRPEEIAITVANLAAWEGRLRFEAELRAIPLDLRQGRSLAEYPEVRLLAELERAVGSGFSLDSLKALFLDRAIPWRSVEGGHALVRFGIEHSCVRRIGRRDPWIEAFEHEGTAARGRASSLRTFYTTFAGELEALVGARTFAELKVRLQSFIRSRLDTSRWPARSLGIFQFALDALNDLVEAEGRSKGLRAPDPYRLWLAYLGERIYVPRPDRQGIPVYPYRVSAGIAPAHHFVLGATQNGTQVEWPILRFLRDHERLALGIADRSATDPFFNLYLQSGKEVRITCSREDAAGAELPPGFFVVRRRLEEAGAADLLAGSDPYELERRIWSGQAEPATRCYLIQRRGVDHFAATAAAPRPDELTREAIEEAALRVEVRARLLDGSGRLVVSPSRLDRYLECPFAFLLQDTLGADEGEYAIIYDDPLRIGRVMHACLQRFFARVRDEDGSFRAGNLTSYRGWMEEIVAGLLREWRSGKDGLIPPVWNALGRKLRSLMASFLDVEATSSDGFEVSGLEEEYRESLAEGVDIAGRIDRVSRRDGRFLLVDYKKRIDPALKRGLVDLAASGAPADIGSEEEPAEGAEGAGSAESAGSAASGSLPSLQIPFYVELLERSGRPVAEARYYDIEQGGYLTAFADEAEGGWIDGEGMNRLRAITRAAIARMAELIARGEWTVPDQAAGCEACTARRICRMKYTVR